MTYLERAQDLYRMIGDGDLMNALDTYYHDDVTVVEADGATRNGKEAQRRAIREWRNAVDEMHGGGADHITSNEEEAVTMVQSTTDLTMNGRRSTMREVAVQEWEGDRIARESFFYYVPAEMQKQAAAG